jgi:peptidoglycan biosynthesis protein MviN/MurJ (putative lipid II flippase)
MIAAIAARLAAVHDNHRRIASGAALIAALMVVAKLFVAGREIAIAWRYGVGVTVDAYQLSLTVTIWLPMMLTSVMTVVLVPRLVGLREDGPARGRFIAELNGTVLLLGIAVALLTFIAAPLASLLLASANDRPTFELTSRMSRAMSPVALFLIGVGYLSARLQSRERFAYSVTEAVPALAIALLVTGMLPIGGTAPLVWGTLAGFFLQALLLAAMVARGDGPLGSISFRHRSPQWGSLYASAAIMAAAQSVMALSIPVDQAFAARLGSGAVATLGYASRIVILVTGLGAAVLARALLPVLSRTIIDGEHRLGARQAKQWAWLLFSVGTAIALAIWVLAGWGISLLFERGAFSATDSAAVARVLRFGAIQLPFYFGGLALVQWLAASQRYGALFAIACSAVLLKVSLNVLLTPALGLVGIMLATAAMYALSFAFQYFSLGRAK